MGFLFHRGGASQEQLDLTIGKGNLWPETFRFLTELTSVYPRYEVELKKIPPNQQQDLTHPIIRLTHTLRLLRIFYDLGVKLNIPE